MRTPLFYTGVFGFVFGVFTRTFIVYGLPEIVFGLSLCFVLALIWRRKSTGFSAPLLRAGIIFSLCFLLASLRVEVGTFLSYVSPLQEFVGTSVTLTGTVVREPEVREVTQNVTVRVGDTLLLVRTDTYTDVVYGDEVSISGTLSVPEKFETEFGRVFDYQKYLEARGIRYIVSFAEVTVTQNSLGNPFIETLLVVKHELLAAIELLIPSPEAGLAEGLLLGVKQGLGESLEDAFRTTGIMHIVVLSGYNMMLVVNFTSFFLSFLFSRRLALLLGALCIVAFTCMVGFSASVVRASIMALLVLLARGTGRTYDAIRALCMVGVLMLLFNPLLLVYDVGFQLSFVATLGIILVTPYVEPLLTLVPKYFGIRELLATTLAVQMFVTPLLLYQIGQFSVVAIMVNMLVLPMVPVAMCATFLASILSFVSTTLSMPFGFLAYLSLAYITGVAEAFARVPLASFTVPPFPFSVVVLSYGILAFILYRYRPILSGVLEVAKTNTVEGWVIVEEEVFKTKIAASKNDAAILRHEETPIFFR